VHRAVIGADSGPGLKQIGRLLWFLLDAGHFPDIGPSARLGDE
jgi:hypothetical protein